MSQGENPVGLQERGLGSGDVTVEDFRSADHRESGRPERVSKGRFAACLPTVKPATTMMVPPPEPAIDLTETEPVLDLRAATSGPAPGTPGGRSISNPVFRFCFRAVMVSVVATFTVGMVLSKAPAFIFGATALNQDRITSAGATTAPMLSGHSSLLSFHADGVRSVPLPSRTVALTFDDGPDPMWTPKVQEMLAKHQVRATFFVVGSQVLRHPEVVKSLHQDGHEIGGHSFTHPRLGQLKSWQLKLQMTLTDRAVQAATGQRVTSFRPPYSGPTALLPVSELEAARDVGGGYLTVLSDRAVADFDDSHSVDELVAQALPPIGSGAVLTFHDGGGDRQRTIDAVEQVIVRLKAAGYTFATPSDFSPHHKAADRTAPLQDVALSIVLMSTIAFARHSAKLIWYIGMAVLIITMVRSWALVGLSGRSIRKARRATPLAPITGPVTVIVPAFNEAVGIEATLRSLVGSVHPDMSRPDLNIVVVDDGSTDSTATIVEGLALPGVRLIRQANQGKAAALRNGLTACETDLVVMIDGDTVFEPGTISELLRPFNDPAVGAVAGNAKVGNRRSLLAKMQHLEYTASSALERRTLEVLGTATCIPGAVGAYRRVALESAGGPSRETLAEDSDLTMSIVRAGWKVSFAPEARAWTEVPTTMTQFYRQRRRWAYGILQAFIKHRTTITERGPSGRLGRIILYQLILCYGMALLAPAIDLLLIYGLFFEPASRLTSIAVWATLTAVQMFLHIFALRADREKCAVALLVPLQMIVYRVVIWLATYRALQAAVLGSHQRWNKLRRQGGVRVQFHRPLSAVSGAAMSGAAMSGAALRLGGERAEGE